MLIIKDLFFFPKHRASKYVQFKQKKLISGERYLIFTNVVVQLMGGVKCGVNWRETVRCCGHDGGISDPVRREEFLY